MIARLAVIATVIAESLAVYVVAELFAALYSDERHAVRAITFVIAGLVAFGLPLFVNWLGLSGRKAIAFTGIISFLVIYGALRIEVANDLRIWDFSWVLKFVEGDKSIRGQGGHATADGLFVLILWVRCAMRSEEEVELEFVPRRMAIPFAIVTTCVVLGAMADRGGEIGRGAGAFFTFGILGLALSQLALSGGTIGTGKSGGVTATLLGGIAAVVVVGVIVFSVVFGVLGPIIGPPLGRGIELLFTIVLTPPAWLLEKFFRFLFGNHNPLAELTDLTTTSQFENGQEAKDPTFRQKTGAFAFRSFALLFATAIFVAAVVYYTSLRRRGKARAPEAPGSSAVGNIGEDMQGLLRSIFRRRGPSRGAYEEEGVGRLYREVLERSEHEGKPRTADATPAEFAPVLSQVFHTNVTDDITAAFEQARYAGRPPDARTLAELEARWKETKSGR
ncbi:hypothetical protein AYO38_10555 [bacterium SCGC AG-212-C10]|nr:hypothetical protein AYO38_10555 [bacterium SCGC AG-212-C10]